MPAGVGLMFQKCLAAADMELQRSGHTNSFKLSLTRSVCVGTRSVNPPPNTWASSREATSHHGSEGQQVHCYQVGIMCFIALSKSVLSLELSSLAPPKIDPQSHRTVKLIAFCGYFHILLVEDTSPHFGRTAAILSSLRISAGQSDPEMS